MQKAISLYLIDPETGMGAEFEADECKHGDCEALGLVCPICYESLFLKEGHYFTSKKGKLGIRPQHFCHHKTGPTGLDCEKRSVGKEGRDYKRLRQIYPRGQTLEKFNRKLWVMILRDNNVPINAREVILRRTDGIDPICVDNGQQQIVGGLAVARLLQEKLKSSSQAFSNALNTIVSKIYDPPKKAIEYQEKHLSQEAQENYAQYIKTNQLFHRAICHEVLEFLKSDSAGYTRLQLVYGAFWTELTLRERDELSEVNGAGIIIQIIALVANVYWNWVIPRALAGEYDHLIEEYNLERIVFEKEYQKKTKGKAIKSKRKGFAANRTN